MFAPRLTFSNVSANNSILVFEEKSLADQAVVAVKRSMLSHNATEERKTIENMEAKQRNL